MRPAAVKQTLLNYFVIVELKFVISKLVYNTGWRGSEEGCHDNKYVHFSAAPFREAGGGKTDLFDLDWSS